MKVAAVQLAGDVARDAHARRGCAGVGHGAGNLRSAVVDGRGRGDATGSACGTRIAKAEILHKAGKRHYVARSWYGPGENKGTKSNCLARDKSRRRLYRLSPTLVVRDLQSNTCFSSALFNGSSDDSPEGGEIAKRKRRGND